MSAALEWTKLPYSPPVYYADGRYEGEDGRWRIQRAVYETGFGIEFSRTVPGRRVRRWRHVATAKTLAAAKVAVEELDAAVA